MESFVTQPSPTSNRSYWAFISYSHHDEYWGKWLHKSLEQYRIPRRFAGKPNIRGNDIPKRLFPIFRDNEELACSPVLGANINKALELSRYLIVICSPHSATSKWVDSEVKYFKALGREDRVLALIVDGVPNASENSNETTLECFPESLRYHVDPNGNISQERIEPLAADVRRGKDSKSNAIIRLAAGLIGVGYDDLRQRDTRRKQNRAIILGCIFIIFAVLAAYAWKSAVERNRLESENQALLPKPLSEELLTEQKSMEDFIGILNKKFKDIRISTSGSVQEIVLNNASAFNSGSSQINQAGKEIIKLIVQHIKEQNFRRLKEIQVYGHTDNSILSVDIWNLSASRAIEVVKLMQASGMDPRTILLTPVAPAEYQPITPNDSTENSQTLNRRVQFKLIYADASK